jgi:metallophosphoesterase superfamily enzyme
VDRLIIAGDLTHSSANKELDLFLKWRKDFSLLHIDLVKGNHDILSNNWYDEANIEISNWKLRVGSFLFLHDLQAETELTPEEAGLYRFTGHLHPGISLKKQGRQTLRFPCFYFTENYAVLPAFSRFTGTYLVTPEKGDSVFAIAGDGIIKIEK